MEDRLWSGDSPITKAPSGRNEAEKRTRRLGFHRWTSQIPWEGFEKHQCIWVNGLVGALGWKLTILTPWKGLIYERDWFMVCFSLFIQLPATSSRQRSGLVSLSVSLWASEQRSAGGGWLTPRKSRNHAFVFCFFRDFQWELCELLEFLLGWSWNRFQKIRMFSSEGKCIQCIPDARQCFLCFWHTWVLRLQVNGRQVALKSSFVCFFFWAFYHPKLENGPKQSALFAWDFCASSHAQKSTWLLS